MELEVWGTNLWLKSHKYKRGNTLGLGSTCYEVQQRLTVVRPRCRMTPQSFDGDAGVHQCTGSDFWRQEIRKIRDIREEEQKGKMRGAKRNEYLGVRV